MWKYIVFNTFAIFVVIASATNVRRCSRGQPLPLETNVVGCEKLPCDIYKGASIIFFVNFVGVAPQTDKLTTKARAIIGPINAPYELPEDVADVCSNLMYGAQCPIYQTEDVVYKFDFFVEEWYPNIPLKVEISLVDEDDQSVACFVTDIKVRS